MAKICLLSLSLVLLFSLSFAQQQLKGQCQIQKINALQPQYKIQSEGGVTESYDYNDDQFQCAGAAFLRHTIYRRSLLLPSYTSSPLLAYAVKGSGILGIMISGCPETFESSQESQQESHGQGQRFRDRHQKIGNFRQGDIIAVPAGAAHWIYNSGNEELVLVVLQDTSNNVNQLDDIPRRFFLAGNPRSGQEQEQQQPWQPEKQYSRFDNVFKGFAVQVLAEAFNVDLETAKKLQGENDQRGHMVNIEQGLQVISPPFTGEEQQYGEQNRRANGLEETICTARVRQNIDNPSRADIYNPRAGRFTTANSLTLPILSFLQLSAARGVLHRKAIMSPHWYMNCHTIVYATKGNARMQIVDNRGQAVFDDTIQEGQVVVVPHNFAVVKQAGDQGFEWVEFNTNENAMINTISGRTSSFRGLPVDVIVNAYQVSRKVAEQLKFNRQETLIFSGGESSGQPRVSSV
ncbi:legumin A-like [Olea europaea subsp. europaea]|uniref:Legumin A-like n=1 Tax=Olea europaea subsp. europaea TaxID=158383 RepID=A0A8S0U1L4_OLEEU|nr:legumin A-like [Olea europaea subsp. europaea]